MSTGIRLFHSRINLQNYVLVKPSETQAYLYKLNKDGSITNDAKPLLAKTYEQFCIKRKGRAPYTEFDGPSHRDNLLYSKTPRNINDIPNNMSQSFEIRNRDGMTGKLIDIAGSVNNCGEIESVSKLQFPLEGFDLKGVTNLTRIYLKKIFKMFSQTPPNKNTYYVSKEYEKVLNELDKEYGVPPFKITDEISNSLKVLAEKHWI